MSLRNLPALCGAGLPRASVGEPDAAILAKYDPTIRAAQEPANTVSILDPIGYDAWTDRGVTAKRVAAALRSIGDGEVHVDINSPGGDFFEGVAIYNALRAHKGKVTVRVLGVAASAASVIAMAADELLVGEAGFLMIHNAWSVVIGNRQALEAAMNDMATFDAAMASVYANRSGQTPRQTAAWMDAETWFNGAQAIDAGLADGFLEADQIINGDDGEGRTQATAVRRVDTALARAGMPRSERRSLLSDLKNGTSGAAVSATQDAGDAELMAAIQATITNITS